MRDEVLRMSDVTYREQGVVQLEDFNLNVFEGEIMGIILRNGHGMTALCRLLETNAPLERGYIYYREQMVNSWRAPHPHDNRIAVIRGQSKLVGGLTVADNIFVLRPGFKTFVIRPAVLMGQVQPMLDSLDVNIAADAYADTLTPFECVVVELVKAVVAGCRLIILREISAVISEPELERLRAILRHYAERGVSFLYIGLHYEEMMQICSRVAVYANGRILKVFLPEDGAVPYDERYLRLVREQMTHPEEGAAPALDVRGLTGGALCGLSFTAAAGECVVVQDLQNSILRDLTDMLQGERPIEAGEIRLEGKPFRPGTSRDMAVIAEQPDVSMVFEQMSYLDNLCMTVDHRVPEVWRSRRTRMGIQKEWERTVGDALFAVHPAQLSKPQKYDLVYQRILLQRPRVVFCVQPFKGADVNLRMHIWELLRRVMASGAALVILAVNLADTFTLATRLVQVENGKAVRVYEQSDFDSLPFTAPWLDLYSKD